ncbi:hypothetical protein FHS18_000604 [Paenibacillus phyllosphaerae]|uniref:Uncharacterized protein n=1 Tax=Paenibacillus phyllosphaerae TaxID=274593 RepID=A0A7W5AUT9_9BACL|nr:hypothetical protein [Paenibacillus phyllosphaerae]
MNMSTAMTTENNRGNITLDVLDVVTQLGLNRSNWPSDLPPLGEITPDTPT